jgi:hypothetical protein
VAEVYRIILKICSLAAALEKSFLEITTKYLRQRDKFFSLSNTGPVPQLSLYSHLHRR